MPRLAQATRRIANSKAVIAPDLDESEHFETCDECGQRFDLRNLGDVLHHAEQGHAPIAAESAKLAFIPPLLPTLAEDPPGGDRWLHEVKYDGYRTQVHVTGGQVRTYTRNAHDWTSRYGPIAACAAKLPCSSAIIDGELIVQDEQGRSDFHALRRVIAREPERLVLMAFDLLHLDGEDLRNHPIERRRELLEVLIGGNDPSRPIHFSEHVIGNPEPFFAAVDAMGLEGIVSKKLGSRYRSGPSKAWLKVKCFCEEELIVVGTEQGDRAPVALLAREGEDGVLEYAGGAMVTLAQPERDLFWDTAETLRASSPPKGIENRKGTTWLRPAMRVKVRTLRGEEMLRHATVRAISSVPHPA